MKTLRLMMIAAVVSAALSLPAAALAQQTGASHPPATSSKRTATTQGSVGNPPATNTGPGTGEPAVHDVLPGRAVRGLILFGVAVAIVVWLARARVRDWMLGSVRR